MLLWNVNKSVIWSERFQLPVMLNLRKIARALHRNNICSLKMLTQLCQSFKRLSTERTLRIRRTTSHQRILCLMCSLRTLRSNWNPLVEQVSHLDELREGHCDPCYRKLSWDDALVSVNERMTSDELHVSFALIEPAYLPDLMATNEAEHASTS